MRPWTPRTTPALTKAVELLLADPTLTWVPAHQHRPLGTAPLPWASETYVGRVRQGMECVTITCAVAPGGLAFVAGTATLVEFGGPKRTIRWTLPQALAHHIYELAKSACSRCPRASSAPERVRPKRPEPDDITPLDKTTPR